ncbi:MAG: SnoaL-like domain-containing protein [Phycisphaerales bacterium]
MSTDNTNVRLNELLGYIREGRIMDAMNEFYADNVTMKEPAYGATYGLKANLDREQQFVDSVAEFKRFESPKVHIGDDTSSYENIMEWTGTDGRDVRVEQVAVQEWKDGKIVHERFYYANA